METTVFISDGPSHEYQMREHMWNGLALHLAYNGCSINICFFLPSPPPTPKHSQTLFIKWQVCIKYHHSLQCSPSQCLYEMEQYLGIMVFLKKKIRIMKQEYDTVELLSSFHVFSPHNWNHFQVLFSTKLISHFHQGTHVDPRVIQIFRYRNS